MANWKTVFAQNRRYGTVDIKRGIFQTDSLTPLLYLMIMIQLSLTVRDTRAGYQLKKEGCNKDQSPAVYE